VPRTKARNITGTAHRTKARKIGAAISAMKGADLQYTKMKSPWGYLPVEVQLLVIGQFLLDLDEDGVRHNIAEYAGVDKTWQFAVEKITFRELKIQLGDSRRPGTLDDSDFNIFNIFETIVAGERINYVKDIHISVSLHDPRDDRTYSPTNTTLPNGCPSILAPTDEEAGGNEGDNGEADVLAWLTLYAECKCTEVFHRLFKMLKGWSRHPSQEPITLTYTLGSKALRLLGPPARKTGTQKPKRQGTHRPNHLRIDATSFPDVPFVGSFLMSRVSSWEMQPISIFEILRKLPNAGHANMFFCADVESHIEEIGRDECLQTMRLLKNESNTIVADGQSSLGRECSNLKMLLLWCTTQQEERLNPKRYQPPSLGYYQSLFTISSKLEKFYLSHLADPARFLRQHMSPGANTPAWPNLKKLWLYGYASDKETAHEDVASDLHSAITGALPHMPSLLVLHVDVVSRSLGQACSVSINVPPRDDRSAMPAAGFRCKGGQPSITTVHKWENVARNQWYCALRNVPPPEVLRVGMSLEESWGILLERI
jgi:hypothetical protein